MQPRHVLHPTPVRDLKRTITNLEFDSEHASKRIRLLPDQLPTPPHSTQGGHPGQSSRLCGSSDWRERLRRSLLSPLINNQCPPAAQQLAANPQLRVWLDAVPYPRAESCPASARIFSRPSCRPSRSDHAEPRRSQSCEARFDLVRHARPTIGIGSDPNPRRSRLTVKALQKMSQQESQYAESVVPRSNASSSKTPGTSDPAYIDTLYGHGIIMDLSGRKIPEELAPLKERILQRDHHHS